MLIKNAIEPYFAMVTFWKIIRPTCRKDHTPVHGLSELVVGVLGGGQLGRMLCQAASQMAIKVMVLDPLENCPASALSYHHVVGSFDNSAMVEEFAKRFIFTWNWCNSCSCYYVYGF